MVSVVPRPMTFVLATVWTFLWIDHAAAQHFSFAGGVNVGSVPRALAPLCASARRLGGIGLSGRVELSTIRVRVGATVEHVARIGVHDAASCIPRSGLSVDSMFARAGRSATTLAVNAWVPIDEMWRIGAEAGRVINHSSWFVGPALGARHKLVQIEVSARRHITRFDEITRDYGPSGVREISRLSRSEGAWGAVARLLITP